MGYDLFSEENIIETTNINNDLEFETSETNFVIKNIEDKDIKTSYGHKYYGSHLDIMEKIKFANDIYNFSLEELEKSINIKNLLESKFNFNGDIKSNDFAKFLINEKGINLNQAFLLQYLVKNLKIPSNIEVGNYIFGKMYSGDNDFVKEVSGRFKDIISYKTYEKFIEQFDRISTFINIDDEENKINSLTNNELLEIINDKIVNKKYPGFKYDINAIQMSNLFNFYCNQEREILVNNFKGGNNNDFIRKDYLNKALISCMNNLKLNFNNSSKFGVKTINDINICLNIFSEFDKLKDSEKNLEKIISMFLNNEMIGFDIPMYGDIYKFKEKELFLSISDYYKENAIKDFPILEKFFKYYDLIVSPSKSTEDLLFYAEKRRNVAAVKKLPDSYKFKVQDFKEGVAILGLTWKNNIEIGLFTEKEKAINYKSTNNKNLNLEIFIEKYPELIKIIDKEFSIDIKEELKNNTSYNILLNAGVKGIELGKTLKNKENVLLNVIACSAVLSKVLNVPINNLFLNNSLGIAIGSRGRGTALAHFEKSNNLIHITQKNEFASFSHEFAHAIDGAIGTFINHEMSNMKYQQPKTNFGTQRNLMLIDPSEFNENNLISKKLITEVYKFKNELKNSDVLKISIKEDKGKYEKYWSSSVELFARTFETFISDKLNELNIPDIGTHGKKYYLENSRIYPSNKDKEKLYPIINNIISLYSEYSNDIAFRRSKEVNKTLKTSLEPTI